MQLKTPDILALVDHLERHTAENGKGGFYFFTPCTLISVLQNYDVSAWGVPSPVRGWQRVWGWLDDKGELRAHVLIAGHLIATHRCSLSVGVEEPYRQQGHGRRLMAEALAWVAEQPTIDWVDSWTFAHNAASLALHHALGFQEVGRTPDVFRIHEQSLDQVLLLIDLRKETRPCL